MMLQIGGSYVDSQIINLTAIHRTSLEPFPLPKDIDIPKDTYMILAEFLRTQNTFGIPSSLPKLPLHLPQSCPS